MTTPETLAERLARCVRELEWEFTLTTYGHKVAPGNFEERPSCEFWEAKTILMRGPYRISRLVDDRIGRLGPEPYRLDTARGELKSPTLEAAQAAAQADYTARILAALDLDALAREVEAMVGAETERCARLVDCGCDPAKKAIAANGGNSGDRWRACQEANCGAQDAAAIRAREGGKP